MKRSSSIKLVLIGSSLVFLSACDQKPEESKTDAQAVHPVKTFTSIEECEKAYGAGKCGSKPGEGDRGLFMPMIAGYMLGSMMNQQAVAPKAQVNTTTRGGFGGQAPRYASAGG